MGGLWSGIKEALFALLQMIESFAGDWGLAIIILTILVRLLLLPLTTKQTKSMYEMQRIQPKIKALQEKYANDKEKLQEETLKFYQENKVNPFGGCLPMLLQMPILFALYWVVGGTAQKPGLLMEFLTEHHEVGRFFFIIPDISKSSKTMLATDGFAAAIPYLILVILFGLSVWLPQALQHGERQQKMMGLYMGAMMLWFGWAAPAGVLLYWDVSSLVGIAQQQIQTALLKRAASEESVPESPAKKALDSKSEAPKKRPKK